MSDYDWPAESLARIRTMVLAHAGLPRHSFSHAYLDARSLRPERTPTHRAGKHVADRHEDSCGLACEGGFRGVPCDLYLGRHWAGEAA